MKLTLLSLSLLFFIQLTAQNNYWQQELRYDINVTLNDVENSLHGFESIVYKNNSPTALEFIWFHIWPNAYSDHKTALMKQIKKDKSRSKKLANYGVGFIDSLNFTVNGRTAKTEPHPNAQYIDIIKLLLDKPLQPGDSITIATPFKVKLPPYFSRSGYADGEFMSCQWYPKPAVYDKLGWHEFPYLDMGEFYSEYADYSVHITVPSAYVIGATGTLQTKAELDAYKKSGSNNIYQSTTEAAYYQPVFSTPFKTLHYYAEQVPDFAWFASKDFLIQYDTVLLPTGKIIDAFSFYFNIPNTNWLNSMDYIKDGVRKYSEWVGEYGYPVVQAVEGPKNNTSGGMEYPMITLVTAPDSKAETLDAIIVHEIGHNWFMSMLGSNERKHTWMDEGLNSYYEFRYEAEKYRANSVFGSAIPEELKRLPADRFLEAVYTVIKDNVPMQSAMDTPADEFPNSEEYGIVSYVKTALWMYMLETSVGKEELDKAVQNYFKKWKNKHPRPEDMKAAFEESINGRLDKFFELTKKKGRLE